MNPSHQTEILAFMRLAPVIPVLTVKDAEDGVAQARALVAGGLLAIEVRDRGNLGRAWLLRHKDAPKAFIEAWVRWRQHARRFVRYKFQPLDLRPVQRAVRLEVASRRRDPAAAGQQ